MLHPGCVVGYTVNFQHFRGGEGISYPFIFIDDIVTAASCLAYVTSLRHALTCMPAVQLINNMIVSHVTTLFIACT